ncbi:MAG: hypothetical protein V3V95_06885 [Thermodesulfobacteriota bacterium]
MPESTDNSRWERASILLLIFSSVIVYLNSLGGEFVFDDFHFIVNNLWIRDWRHIPEILFSPVFASLPEDQIGKADPNFYRPGFHFFLMIGYAISGLKPWGYHIVNIIIHTINVLLLFFISKPIIGDLSFLGSTSEFNKRLLVLVPAMIFAVHPIHAENVAFISGINVLGLAIFYLLSFLLYTRERFILSAIAFFLAMLTKETAITLPVLLLVYDLKIKKKPVLPIGFWVKRFAPLAVAFAAYFAIRLYSLGAMVPTANEKVLTPYLYIINLLPLIGKIFRKLILPYDLAFYVYQMSAPLTSLLDIRAILLLILLCALIFITIKIRRSRPAIFLCALWIALPLVPVFFFGWVQGAPLYADRFLYSPCAGYSILAGLLVAISSGWLDKKIRAKEVKKALYNNMKIALAVFIVAALILLSIGTIKRNFVWRSQITIIEDTLEKAPDYQLFRFLYTRELSKLNRIDEAIVQLKISIKADYKSPNLHNNLGVFYGRKKLFKEAIGEFRIALALDPQYEIARKNLEKIMMIMKEGPPSARPSPEKTID